MSDAAILDRPDSGLNHGTGGAGLEVVSIAKIL